MSQQSIDDFLMLSEICDDNLPMFADCIREIGGYPECHVRTLRHVESMRHSKLHKCVSRVLDIEYKELNAWINGYVVREVWDTTFSDDEASISDDCIDTNGGSWTNEQY